MGRWQKEEMGLWLREFIFKVREITQVPMLPDRSSGTKTGVQGRELPELPPFVRGEEVSGQVEGLGLHVATVSPAQ